jgi:hypothetical protein
MIRISRNAPCPCKSGKKFKNCCLNSNRFAPTDGGLQSLLPPRQQLNALLPPSFTPKDCWSSEELDLRKDWKELHFDVPLQDGSALHIVLLHSEHWLRKQRLCAGQVADLNLPQIKYQGQALLTQVSPAEWNPSSEGEIKSVFLRDDDEDNGALVLGARRSRQKGSFAERCGNLRMVFLEFIERRGQMARRVNIRMLRSLEWIQEHRVRIGGSVFLDEVSEGVKGDATVQDIRRCPSREECLGKMSIGEYKPWPCRAGDLKIVCEKDTIGVTPTHPFWCPNKNDWVAAGRLEPGDLVQTMNGPSPVEWYVMREKPEPAVYNIEVDGDHVYRVGKSGVLVHNASAGVATAQQEAPHQECPCETKLPGYNWPSKGSGVLSPAILKAEFPGLSSYQDLWSLACHIGGGTDGAIAIAIVCVKGETKFRVVAASSRRNEEARKRAVAAGVEWQGSESSRGGIVHAEDVILGYKYNDRDRHIIVAIAASLCICQPCVTAIARRDAQIESPADYGVRTGEFPSVCTGRVPNRSESCKTPR